MALAATGVFEVRPDGQASQTGYFNAARGGTDYSQQAAAQMHTFDGVTNGTATVTSASGLFTAPMVGNGLAIGGGPWCEIIAVNSATSVTVDRNVGAGTGQTLTVGGATTMATNNPAPGFQGVLQAGQKLWVRGTNSAGTAQSYGMAGYATGAAAATAAGPIATEGYGTVRGDGGQAVIDVTGQVTPTSYEIWNNLQFVDTRVGATLPFFYMAGAGNVGAEFRNLTVIGKGSAALFQNSAAGSAVFVGCLFDGNGTTYSVVAPFLEEAGGSYYRDCVFRNFVTAGQYSVQVSPLYTSVFEGCVFYQCGGAGGGAVVVVNGTQTMVIFRRCLFWHNTGDGAVLQSGNMLRGRFESCLFGRNTGYDLNSLDNTTSVSAQALWAATNNRCNMFYTTGVARYQNLTASPSETSLTANPFTNDATGDFSLNTVTGGGALVLGDLCSTALPGLLNTNDVQIAGPYGQAVAPAATQAMRSLWRDLVNELDSATITDTMADTYIQRGLEALNRLARYHWTTDSASITLVAGQQEYPLPTNIMEIEWIEWQGKELDKESMALWRRGSDPWRTEPDGAPRGWCQYGQTLIFRPTPDAATVAKQANPILRCVTMPDSFTTFGPLQLQQENWPIPVFYAAALWSTCHPESALSASRAKDLMDLFNNEAERLVAQYGRHGLME